MKQRFSSLDVMAIVRELQQTIVDCRLQNVYDISDKCYLFKFNRPDKKEVLLVESGIRMHLTKFFREKSTFPNNFAMKLRKHLRARRLIAVRQLGVDRIVDFEFACSAAGNYHLFVELYAGGNIILTDAAYNIIYLLRIVLPPAFKNNKPESDAATFAWGRMAVGERYAVECAQTLQTPSHGQLQANIATQNRDPLRKTLATALGLGAHVAADVLQRANIAANAKGPVDDGILTLLCDAASASIEAVCTSPTSGIVLLNDDGSYADFVPFCFEWVKMAAYTQFSTFNDAVDAFFTAAERTKAANKAIDVESVLKKKLEAVRSEQQSRVSELEATIERLHGQATALEANIPLVDDVLLVVRTALANALSWEQLAYFVEVEAARGNPVAAAIAELRLAEGAVLVRVSAADGTLHEVSVDVNASTHASIQRLWDARKAAAAKRERTLRAHAKALRSAEARVRLDARSAKVTHAITKVRRAFWFEKFYWFISSENFLVVAGRDAQQNETLVKRHLNRNDVYVHADMHGAASVIVKNAISDERTPPPSTLAQAACAAVCTSRAWDARIVTSAWWVHAAQVSKSAPSGEFLPTGSFMVRGRKNFLPPSQLVYGFGVMFRIADECIAAHSDDRPRADASVDASVADAVARYAQMNLAVEADLEETPVDAFVVDLDAFPDAKLSDVLDAKTRPSPSLPKQKSKGAKNSAVPVSTLSSSSSQQQEATKAQDAASQQVRGKRGKLKKIKEKYQHQDDEERVLRMQLLGHKTANESEDAACKNKRNFTQKTKATKANGKAGFNANENSKQKATAKFTPPKEASLHFSEESVVAGKDQNLEQVDASIKAAGIGQESRQLAAAVQLNSNIQSASQFGEDAAESLQESALAPNDAAEACEPEREAAELSDAEADDVQAILHDGDGDNDGLLSDAAGDSGFNLSCLVESPLPEDILMHAVCVCAPYTAMKNFKYKVKLTPGTLKRGKAARLAVSAFVASQEPLLQAAADSPAATERLHIERSLIKAIPDAELNSTMMGKVKVAAPNIENVKKKEQKRKNKK